MPLDPTLWTLDRFPDFLAARRELLASRINEYIGELPTSLVGA